MPAHNPDSLLRQTVRHTRRVIVLVVGLTIVVLGVAGLVLPMVPGFILIPAGVAILATEFVWARRLLRRVRYEVATKKRRRRAQQS